MVYFTRWSIPQALHRGGKWEWWAAIKWQVVLTQKFIHAEMAVLSFACSKSMASLSNQLCGDSLLAFFLSRQDGAIYRPLEHSQMLDKLPQ